MNSFRQSRREYVLQIAWLALAIGLTVAWAVALVSQWDALRTPCHFNVDCAGFQLDVQSARTLSEYGISTTGFAVFTVAVSAATWIFWLGLAGLIIWRRPDDRGAIFTAFFLTTSSIWQVGDFIPSFTNVTGGIAIALLILSGILFPDARFQPRWTRWLAIVGLFEAALTPLPAPAWMSVPLPFVLVVIIGAQVYRFRYISTWAQRQQTKWALLGFVIGILGFVALALPFLVAPNLVGYGSLYDAFTNSMGTAIVTSAIPLFLGIAVLRSRLWDIDRVINRVLVYLSVTATLAAIYLVSVIGLQLLFRLVAGTSSTPAITISTLAIAALFGPLRRRIQRIVDRRFYREKYDAERILEAFGDRLRDEIDLQQLSRSLTEVVSDALHPEHVSLWLRGE